MTITVKIEKHPLTNFAPSKYCEWCVTVTTSDAGGFTGPDGEKVNVQWALDFPPDTDILDPEQAKKIKGAPRYTLDPGPQEGTVTKPGQKSFRICFVAACKEREGTDMSLERRIDYPGGAGMAPREWHLVPHEGGESGVGRILGPAAVAMAPAHGDDVALLANFEAQKLASLFGIGSIRHAGMFMKKPSHASAERLYVTGEVDEKS